MPSPSETAKTMPAKPESDDIIREDVDYPAVGSSRDFLSSFLIVTGGCICLYLVIQDQFVVSPNAVANVAILWVTSIGLGYLFLVAGIPPLLGSLMAGIILQNAVGNFDLSHRFGETIETVGLCTILLISSTEIDVNAVASAGGVSLRLTFLPGLVEAAGCSAAAYLIFGMPLALAFSLGFILAAVSFLLIFIYSLSMKK